VDALEQPDDARPSSETCHQQPQHQYRDIYRVQVWAPGNSGRRGSATRVPDARDWGRNGPRNSVRRDHVREEREAVQGAAEAGVKVIPFAGVDPDFVAELRASEKGEGGVRDQFSVDVYGDSAGGEAVEGNGEVGWRGFG